uniref:RHS repeat-associated core domain-containing protein n=1 Tax=Anaerosporobacter sp. TaxID=1872529 RepID=UPI00286F2439
RIGEQTFIPFRFQGQYEDEEIGLYYNRFRYYSPEDGCYTQQDPIGLAGGIRLYGYVHDSNTWIDPFGLAKANGGEAPKHGGTTHNKRIDDLIQDLVDDFDVDEIRKNQCQVDIAGNTVGKNRPDVQYNKNGVHHNVEFDTVKKSSTKHQQTIPGNDPNAKNMYEVIDPKTGDTLEKYSQQPKKNTNNDINNNNKGGCH